MNKKPSIQSHGGALPGSAIANIIAAAKRTLPAETGKVARAEARAARGEVRVVLADVSESMNEMAGARSKYEILQEAIMSLTDQVEVVAFSSSAADILRGRLPPAAGSTALHLAISHIIPRDPTHVLVISDGHPDDPEAALRAADQLQARIDIIFCGPDSDRAGLMFMQRLARGGGIMRHCNLRDNPAAISATAKTLFLAGK